MTTRVVKNMLYKGVVGYVLDTGVIYKKKEMQEKIWGILREWRMAKCLINKTWCMGKKRKKKLRL